MAAPDFILALREHVGTSPLWLSGATAVVHDDTRVLLVRRSDNGMWTPITGIIDPGEQPADAAAREAAEEAGVEIEVQRLAGIDVTDEVVYENGDRSRYLDLTFECRLVSGEPRPDIEETTEVAWFDLDNLPPMSDELRKRIQTATNGEVAARFRRVAPSVG